MAPLASKPTASSYAKPDERAPRGRARTRERQTMELATFRRKIHDFRDDAAWAADNANPPGQPGGFAMAAVGGAGYGSPSFWIARRKHLLVHDYWRLIQLDHEGVFIGRGRRAGKPEAGGIDGRIGRHHIRPRPDHGYAVDLRAEKDRIERPVSFLVEFYQEARRGIWSNRRGARKRRRGRASHDMG